MIELKQTDACQKWQTKLKDERTRVLIASRLDRLAYAHAGDVEPVGEASASYVFTMAPATVFILRSSP